MVCLTSCVFRSIRFSGFARPHFGVRREGELYTHAQAGGKRGRGAPSDAHKLGTNSSLGAFPARRGARTPPPCSAPSPRRSPTAPLPHTARLPCGKAGLVCLAYIVRAGSAQRTGDTRGRTHRRVTRYRTRRRTTCRLITAKAATRPIRRASLPAAPRPSGLPPPAQKSPRPEAALGCGPERRVPVLVFLTSRRPGGGRRWP